MKNDVSEEAYASLMDEPCYCEDDYDDIAYEKVRGIAQAITKSKQPDIVIDFLMQDPNFAKHFGGGDVLDNITTYLKASNEELTGDILTNVQFGGINKQFSSIQTICKEAIRVGVDERKFDRPTTKTRYLPPYADTVQLLKGMEILGNAITMFKKDPKAQLAPIARALGACGIKVQYTGDIDKIKILSVSSSLGAIAFAIIGTMIFPGVGTALGAAAGDSLDSHGIKSLYDKKYTARSLIGCAKQILKLIGQYDMLKTAKPADISSDAIDLDAKRRFVRKALKIYVKTIQTIGRGLSVVLYHTMKN